MPESASGDQRELAKLTAHVGQLLITEEVRIKAYILSIMRDPEAADEIFQQVAVTALQKAERFEPGSNFRAWAFSIARLACLEHFRKASRAVASSELIDLMADEAAGAEEEPQHLVSALYECLGEVPDDSRKVLFMRYVEGCPVETIASFVSRTVQATYALIKRLKTKVRECLQRKSGFSVLPVQEV